MITKLVPTIMKEKNELGGNPLPHDAQEKLGEFIDWLEVHYKIDQGSTALYWDMSYYLASRIHTKEENV